MIFNLLIVTKIFNILMFCFFYFSDPNRPMNLDSMYSNLQWPVYDGTSQIYLDITTNMGGNSAKSRLRAHAVEFWNNVLPKLQSLGKQ